jgi:peptidoglycan/LPS O-acetylase OafA/YrhL
VTIFFLISGFLLYRPFIAHRAGGAGAPKVTDYAKRRLLRIYPAYWLVVTVLVVVPGLTGVVNGEWLTQYGLVQTLPLQGGAGCIGAAQECGLAQTWSLAIEITFYAALPFYVLFAAWLVRGSSVRSWMWTELAFLAALAAISVGLDAERVDPGARSWVGGSVVGYMLWFALGMGFAVISVAFQGREHESRLIRLVRDHPLVPWSAAVALYLLLVAWLPPTPFLIEHSKVILTHVAFAAIAALLLLPAVFGDRGGGLPRRVLANPIVAWLGLISYGIFLWHYAAAQQLGREAGEGFVVVLLGTLVISIACAAISYYFVERPFLRLKYRRLSDVLRVGRAPPERHSGS